jgi:CheY-like chemotaxis protein
MRFPIDVVFLDQELVVLRIDPELRSFHTASCRGAREVVELAAGECAQRGLAVGDRVAWASYAAVRPASESPGIDRPIEGRPRAIVASRDARFVKLARFFLDQNGIEPDSVTPEKLRIMLESDDDISVVILDAQDAVADALTAANTARATRPEVPILVVGETAAAERAPLGMRVYDKWNETDELVAAVKQLLSGEGEQ